jgi:drug/metabolite transporter (DMT)-like permease
MIYLVVTSFVWAFSFGLVKGQLTGVDPLAVSTIRLALAALVFAPFLRLGRIPLVAQLRLALIGALQFGLMYVLYLKSFHYLQAFEIALFTVFTPLYIVFVDALLERRWETRYLFAAIAAAAGAAILLDPGAMDASHWRGFLLIQGSNLCFAVGQLAWRREHRRLAGLATEVQLFALTYLGALLLTALISLETNPWRSLSLTLPQGLTLLYLGLVASGLCFFLWNLGAQKVNAGMLAVLNNLKMPLAVACSLFFFHEQANLPRLLLGSAVILCGIALANRRSATPKNT